MSGIRSILMWAAGSALLAGAGAARAALVTTITQQAAGTDWTQAGIWSNNAAPSAGNTYEALAGGGPTRLRSPMVNPTTFAGDSLQIDANAEIRFKKPGAGASQTANFPGVGGNPGLILNGGLLNTGDDGAVFTVAGRMSVIASSFWDNTTTGGSYVVSNSREFIFSAVMSGGSPLTLQSGRVSDGTNPAPAWELTGVGNTYSGAWNINQGFLKATSSGSLGTGNIAINSSSSTVYGVLETDYDIYNPAATLTIGQYGVMRLDQNDTFAAVTINGTSLASGVYSYRR